ncbi:MAG: hypothetical protein WDW38_003095 [Sanguina aurantia]
MSTVAENGEEELLDYEEEEAVDTEAATKVDAEKKGYVGIHATGFKELMLKPELLQAITACGFEHPSEGMSPGLGSLCLLVSGAQLAKDKALPLSAVRCFVLDECDKMLEKLDMRADIQEIFKMTPHEKQVLMFSATLSADIRNICKKFMSNPQEVYVDDESKLTLHGLVQHYMMLHEEEKNRKLNDLLDALDFNQVVIFVKSVPRARELNRLLNECNFPSVTLYGGMDQKDRIETYTNFKSGKHRILVATDLVGRGIDIERVNIVINYDMPETDERHGNGADTYLHRVGRAGRFGTKGLAITFVSSEDDSSVLNAVQERFDVDIKPLPEKIDAATYMNTN